ncbi:MAG: mechanosensitive ion channel family protein [Erysipelotrichaceae bacterium]
MSEIIEMFKPWLAYEDNMFTYGLVGFVVISILYIIVGEISKQVIRKIVLGAKKNEYLKMKKIEDSSDTMRKEKSKETSYGFIGKVLEGVVNAVVFLLIVYQVKPLATLVTAALGATSVLAVVVGLAAQDSTANIIGGLFLSFYQPFVKGDLINIPEKNISGKVIDIGLRHTVVETIYRTTVIIPNSIMNSAIVENREEHSQFSNYMFFTISYDSDVDKAIDILRDLTIKHPLVISDDIKICVSDLLDSSVQLRVLATTKTYPEGIALKNEMNYQVLKAFKEANITIPFPSRTLYMQKDA